MKFIIAVVISTSLRVNLARIMLSPMMEWGGDKRVSKIALKKSFFSHSFERFPSAVSTSLLYFLNIFPFWFCFKVPFAKTLARFPLPGSGLGVCEEQGFTFQISHLID